MSTLRENWLIWPQNRLNLHDLVVKKRGGGEAGPNRAHTWIRPWFHHAHVAVIIAISLQHFQLERLLADVCNIS